MTAALLEVPSRINCGAQVGEGGEGRIYAVENRTDLVVKVYHQPLTAKKAAKIQAMIARTPEGVASFAAWPLKLLQDKQGLPSAVVMPRIEAAKDIHLLYSPKARRQHFPRADWSFLVLTAQNLAVAFANVHSVGCVIGDVNHGSVLVKNNAQVALIDCDSFQMRADGQLYECEVAVPTFTPPELQSQSLVGVERTPQHDAFGLAVLVFHLLFMGRHPFAGRPLTRTDLSIEQAIKEYRFAFSDDRTRVQLDPPPHTLPLAAAAPAIASLFERAFSKSASRPTPLEWNTALGALRGSLARCTKEASHAYFKGLSTCPWCTIEASSGAVLFYSPQRAFAAPPVERDELGIGVVDALWRAIATIQRPVQMQAPSIAVLAPGKTASSEAVKAGAFASAVSKVSYGVAAAAGVGAVVAAPQQPIAWGAGSIAGFWLPKLALSALNNGRVNTIALTYQAAKTRWDNIGLRWRGEADPAAFESALTQYTRLRQEHDRLAEPIRRRVQQRATALTSAVQRWTADIARQARDIRSKVAHHQPITVALSDEELVAAYNLQMEAHLDHFSIEKADIPDIGTSRKVKLASFGIETASDVLQHKVQGVPGFGPSLTKRLMDWRKEVAAKFRFNQTVAKSDVDAGRVRPSQAPQPPPPITVDEATKRRLRQIEADLSAGAPRLQHLAMSIRSKQEALLAEARLAAAEFAQAEADARMAKIIS